VDLIDDLTLDIADRLGFGSEALLSLVRGLREGWWDESTRDAGRITFQVGGLKPRFVDRTDAPVRDEKGRVLGLLMVFADVTEERELSQARDDLSSMIVHDLRGPLTAVTTSLTLLKEMASPGDPLGKTVIQTTDTSSRAVRKLLNLVNSLLDVYKIESGALALECEPTLLLPLCRTVIAELAPLAQEMEVRLTVDIPDDLPVLDTDADKIERVLLNLVDNAIKFTPAGGEVIVQARPAGDGNAPDGYVRVEVRDTGPGIPDDSKERLFDRFTQLDGVRGRRRGTGLGLTYCRLAVEAHGGHIWVEDNPQGGAIFAFTLPLTDVDGSRLPDAGEGV
jgi:signal transduction histidine kinase